MNQSRKNFQINKIPVIIAIILSAIVLGIGALIANQYVHNDYWPAMDANQTKIAMQITQTEENARYTASSNSATQTFVSLASLATQSADITFQIAAQTMAAQQTAISFQTTETARPSPTPNQITTCEAVITGAHLISPVPGWLEKAEGAAEGPSDNKVTVDGRLSDPQWVHIKTSKQNGFIRVSNLNFDDPSCKPSVADLSYLAQWLKPDWRVLVDDTFAPNQNQYIWFRQDNNIQIETKGLNSGLYESYLPVSANNQELVFSTDELLSSQVSDFNLFTYFVVTGNKPNGNSNIGFRFYENNDSFYQLRFFLSKDVCAYSIYEDAEKVSGSSLPPSICPASWYALMLSFDDGHNLSFSINGIKYGSIKIKDPQDLFVNGGISLSLQNLAGNFNYIVVTAPR
jgi:hypothetical protein